MIKIYKTENYDKMSRKAANIISAEVILNPSCVLGLATGSSPVGLYKNLIEFNKNGDLDFSEVKTINLDEYIGITPENDQSYRYFMDTNLFNHVNIKKENTNVPNGMAQDIEKECERYNNIIKQLGPVNLQLLGIGRNGHIGFNEPDDHFEAYTHKVLLAESTIEANKRFFEKAEDVPKYAISMGIKNIFSAEKILVIASGEDKADAVYSLVYGQISPNVPCTALQLHNNVVLVADKAALSKVKESDIYKTI